MRVHSVLGSDESELVRRIVKACFESISKAQIHSSGECATQVGLCITVIEIYFARD